MDWLSSFFENLPKILAVLAGNKEGLVGFVWVVAAFAIYFVLKDAPPKVRAAVLLMGFLGTVYLVRLIIITNNNIIAQESGYTFYQVTVTGELAPPDGRLYVLKGAGHQYSEIHVGDQLKVADSDGAKLYDVPHKDDTRLKALTDGFACLLVEETGHPQPVSNPPGSGGWFKVRVIPCASRG